MEIRLNLDPYWVWRLQEDAERRGLTAADVLREKLRLLDARQPVPNRVERLVLEGWCDADIGLEIGMSNGSIARIRRGLGLDPNPRFRRHSSGA